MIAALLCVMLAAGAPPASGKDPVNKGEKDNDLVRLRGQVADLAEQNRAFASQVVALEKRLSKCQKEFDRLSRSDKVEDAEAVRREDGQLLARYFRAMAAGADKVGLSASQKRSLLGAHEAMMEEWAEGKVERTLLIAPSQKWLRGYCRKLEERIRWETRELTIQETPAIIIGELSGMDRAEKARRIAGYVGLEVYWRGKVVEIRDNPIGHQVEAYCDGALVRIKLQVPYPGALPRLRINSEFSFQGEISAVEGDAYNDFVITIRDGVIRE